MNQCNCSFNKVNGRFKYNPDTGIITNRVSSRKAKEGEEAGTRSKGGYRVLYISKRKYLGHRIAWFIYYGSWPKHTIDHINGVTDDNRIANLRDVEHKVNQKNLSMQKSNTSGYTGVYWNKPTKNWRVKIEVNGKQIHIGYFKNITQAIKARTDANIKYGFHKNHGRAV